MKFWIKLLVTILLCGLLLGMVEWRESLAILADIDPAMTLISFAICVLGIVLSALRWNVLLRGQEIRISTYDALSFYWIGSFFGNYLPSAFGGDVVRDRRRERHRPEHRGVIRDREGPIRCAGDVRGAGNSSGNGRAHAPAS